MQRRTIQSASPTFSARFWAKVDRFGSEPSHMPGIGGCWLWTASLDGSGRGQIGLGRSGLGNIMAHRASWELAHGPIPDGLCVLHKCDRPHCVNPDHLFLGTQADNLADMAQKGRGRKDGARGEEHPGAILEGGHVRAARSRFEAGERICDLAREYGMSHSGMSAIVHRRTWRHIE